MKQVTGAYGKLYTNEKREVIRGQDSNKRRVSGNESKQDLMNNVGRNFYVLYNVFPEFHNKDKI